MKNQIQKCNGLTPISFILFCLLVLPPLGGLEGGALFLHYNQQWKSTKFTKNGSAKVSKLAHYFPPSKSLTLKNTHFTHRFSWVICL